MNELDIAMVVIFLFGLLGAHIEPWSPHPPLMIGAGLLYFGAKIAVHIIGSIVLSFRRYKWTKKE